MGSQQEESGCSSCCLWGSIAAVLGAIVIFILVWMIFFRETDLFSKSKKEVLAAVDAVKKEKLGEDAKKTLKANLTKFFELLAAYEEKKKIGSVESVSIKTDPFSAEAFDGKVDEAFGKFAKYIKDDTRATEQFGATFSSITATFKFSKEVDGKKTLSVGGLFGEMQANIDRVKKAENKDKKQKKKEEKKE